MICKHCNKDFHYCTGCETEFCAELEYCSDECLESSKD